MSAPQRPPAPHDAQAHEGGGRAIPARYVIRISKLAYLAVFLLFFSVSVPVVALPAAFGWLLLLPIGVLVWMMRSRTTVTADGLAARTVFGSRSVAWEQVEGVRFPKRGWARAHLTDGSEVTLPAVSFDRLPELAAVSRGRIPDPYARMPLREEATSEEAPRDAAPSAEAADGGTDARG